MLVTWFAIFIIMMVVTAYAATRPSNSSTRVFFVLMIVFDLLTICVGLVAALFRMGG
jgi:hypothetical protein